MFAPMNVHEIRVRALLELGLNIPATGLLKCAVARGMQPLKDYDIVIRGKANPNQRCAQEDRHNKLNFPVSVSSTTSGSSPSFNDPRHPVDSSICNRKNTTMKKKGTLDGERLNIGMSRLMSGGGIKDCSSSDLASRAKQEKPMAREDIENRAFEKRRHLLCSKLWDKAGQKKHSKSNKALKVEGMVNEPHDEFFIWENMGVQRMGKRIKSLGDTGASALKDCLPFVEEKCAKRLQRELMSDVVDQKLIAGDISSSMAPYELHKRKREAEILLKALGEDFSHNHNVDRFFKHLSVMSDTITPPCEDFWAFFIGVCLSTKQLSKLIGLTHQLKTRLAYKESAWQNGAMLALANCMRRKDTTKVFDYLIHVETDNAMPRLPSSAVQVISRYLTMNASFAVNTFSSELHIGYAESPMEPSYERLRQLLSKSFLKNQRDILAIHPEQINKSASAPISPNIDQCQSRTPPSALPYDKLLDVFLRFANAPPMSLFESLLKYHSLKGNTATTSLLFAEVMDRYYKRMGTAAIEGLSQASFLRDYGPSLVCVMKIHAFRIMPSTTFLIISLVNKISRDGEEQLLPILGHAIKRQYPFEIQKATVGQSKHLLPIFSPVNSQISPLIIPKRRRVSDKLVRQE